MNLFTLLEEEPSSAEDLAGRLHADPRGLTILLDALAAMGLLAKEADTYRSAPDAAPFLTDKSPRSVVPMILHAAHLWESWSNLTPIVRGAGSSEPPASEPGTPTNCTPSSGPCTWWEHPWRRKS